MQPLFKMQMKPYRKLFLYILLPLWGEMVHAHTCGKQHQAFDVCKGANVTKDPLTSPSQ